MLHTGRGACMLGLALSFCAAGTPFLAASGPAISWRRCRSLPRRGAVPLTEAETVVMVGSEGGTTWRFVATLHAALQAAGHNIDIAPMNELGPDQLGAERQVILAAMAGDGAALASASAFLGRLERLDGHVPVALLGLGDRTFPHFCGYSQIMAEALEHRG